MATVEDVERNPQHWLAGSPPANPCGRPKSAEGQVIR
jgi:hypothetical protein